MLWKLGLIVSVVSVVATAACGSVSSSGECGDGEINGDEVCDQGQANGAADSCCTAECTFVAASTVCRAASGECDAEETCDGATATCPADAFADDGTSCTGNGEAICSNADTCMSGVCSDNDAVVGEPCGTDECFLETCDADGACPAAGVQTIAIIESQSAAASQNMDAQWLVVAGELGHTAEIFPQTHLDDINNLNDADILIVASGTIDVPQARVDVIADFLASGRGVFLQGEFQATFAGNVVFEAIADAEGAAFDWGAEIIGQFNAVPSDCFATTPNVADVPFNQNFAVTGAAAGQGVKPVQINQDTNEPIAFSFCRASGGGLMIVKTDQDDIRAFINSVPDLMKNILYRLSFSRTCVQ